MKKTLAIFVVIALFISITACLTACSSNNTNSNNGVESSKQNVLLSREEKANYLNEPSPSYYGVGRTVNAIEDKYINVDTKYTKIFDENKLLDLNWYTSFVGLMEASNIQATSMREFYSKMNNNFELALSAKVGIPIFSAGVNASFGFASGEQYSNVSNEIYHQAYQYYVSNSVEIDERTNLSQFKNIIKPTVLDDARKMSSEEFVGKYGTHVILAAYYGGKIEYNYYLSNNGTKWDTNTELKFSNGISASIGKLASGKIESNFSIQSEIGCNVNETYSRFNASAIGGTAFKALNEKDFVNNYGKWIDSMDGRTVENSCIVGLPAKSLVAIWDLFPDEYNNERIRLTDYFHKQAVKISNDFLAQYKRNNYTVPDSFTIDVRGANNEIRVVQGNDIYDLINIPFDYSELVDKNGQSYNRILINVSFQLKETGTCYQHVDLLDGNRNTIYPKQFEQGGNTLRPYNKYERFEYQYETTINDLKNRYPYDFQLWLKYRANGNGWDANEFYIKDVKVKISLSV